MAAEYQATLPTPDPSSSFWHTEPSSLLLGHRTTRELPEETDVVVIGSGISGVGVVYNLLEGLEKEAEDGEGKGEEREKLNVLMLEAREVCWGATGRNGGHCQPIFYEHPTDPSIAQFELQNLLTLQSLTSTLDIPCEFATQPGIRALYSPSDLKGAITSVSTLRQNDPSLGSRVRIVTSSTELQTLGLNADKCVGAVVTDIAARLWPYKLVTGLLEHILTCPQTNLSLNLQTLTAVTSLSPSATSGKWSVTTDRGTVTSKRIILATNAYTSFLLPSFKGLIVPCRGQMSALLPPMSLSGDYRTRSSFGFIGDRRDDYLIQRPADKKPGGEYLMFGGGRSYGPSLGICDDGEVDVDVARYLRTAIPEILVMGDEDGEKELEARFEWTGIMGFSRDNLPWVGPVPGTEGAVFVVGGYTGHGMPNAWLCGKAVAGMVRGGLKGAGVEEMIEGAVEGGLPRAYVLDEKRLARARELESVEVQDRNHMFKAEQVE